VREFLETLSMLSVAYVATAVVLTRRSYEQVLVFGLFGMTLTILLIVLQAPDVALSELVVSVAIYPMILLLTLRKISRRSE
jgi:energy-converting hydrogenase B subunit D